MPATDTLTDLDDELESLAWPYLPANDLPQMILFFFANKGGPITGVFWAEAMGWFDFGIPSRLNRSQIERMAAWLDHWLEHESRGFTEQGAHKVRRMIQRMQHCLALIAREKHWRRQCESTEWDHLL